MQIAQSIQESHSPGDYAAQQDNLEALGFTLKPYRKGYMATKYATPNALLFIFLCLISYGILGFAYLLIVWCGPKTRRIYLKPTFTADAD